VLEQEYYDGIDATASRFETFLLYAVLGVIVVTFAFFMALAVVANGIITAGIPVPGK
jgi:hypothetical protein